MRGTRNYIGSVHLLLSLLNTERMISFILSKGIDDTIQNGLKRF